MTVEELIEILRRVDGNREVIINAPFQGWVQVNVAYRDRLFGVENLLSTESVNALVLTNGSGDHMIKAHAIDVVGCTPSRRLVPAEK